MPTASCKPTTAVACCATLSSLPPGAAPPFFPPTLSPSPAGLLSSVLSTFLLMRFATWAFGGRALLLEAELYVGLVVFAGYVVYDTQVGPAWAAPSAAGARACRRRRQLPLRRLSLALSAGALACSAACCQFEGASGCCASAAQLERCVWTAVHGPPALGPCGVTAACACSLLRQLHPVLTPLRRWLAPAGCG